MEQKIYRIQYTYTEDTLEPEMQVTIGPATLIEAVSYVRTIAIIFKKTVEIVSVQASQDGEEWADVPDWDVQERKYRAELAGKEKNDVERD
ncbi:hypothetical protein [uncultured Parabacteroides sp.]|jgi:hypothetical protein|uniref:hypothetical protein n=1 Tax=uncultured Parabacteroides sp. TaxID=512312 RepID=UPI002729BD7A|nr:hypothetical protein [uncultured Parabacteroides sp.]